MAITTVVSTQHAEEGGYVFNVVFHSKAEKSSHFIIHVKRVDRGLAMIYLDNRRSIGRLSTIVEGCFDYESNFFEELKKAFHIRADTYIVGFQIHHCGVVIQALPSSHDAKRIFDEWCAKRELLNSSNGDTETASISEM